MTALIPAVALGAATAAVPAVVTVRPHASAVASGLASWATWICAATEVRDAAEVAAVRVLGASQQARSARARRDAHRFRPVAVARRGRARRAVVVIR